MSDPLPTTRNTVTGDVDGTLMQADDARDIHFHPVRTRVIPAGLPPAPSRWAPDLTTLARLGVAVDAVLAQPTPLVVLVGPASVGKTALALRWAYLHAELFPDGGLYADAGPGADVTEPPPGVNGPVLPSTILAGWLATLGEPAPQEFTRVVSAWRTATADRRLVTVVDDAFSAAQVRGLLHPGLTLVTSRLELSGLSLDGARFLYLPSTSTPWVPTTCPDCNSKSCKCK